jgi:hypothetical protein
VSKEQLYSAFVIVAGLIPVVIVAALVLKK